MKGNQFTALAGNFIKRTLSSPLSFIIYFLLPPLGLLGIYYLMKMTPDSTGADIQGIGFLQYFVFLQACLISGLVVKDKEEGILIRIRTAPVSEFLYAVSNGAAAFLIVLIQCSLSLALAVFLFGLSVVDSYFLLLGVFSIVCFAATGIGLLLSAASRDTTQGAVLTNVFVTLTSLMGGAFFPVYLMSPIMQRSARLFPQYWGGKAVGAAMDGKGAEEILLPLLVLVLFGFLALTIYAYIRKREEL